MNIWRKVTLRPGVILPDWTIIRTEATREAFEAAFDAFDMGQRLSGIDGSEDQVWRVLLTLYGRRGKAPSIEDIAEVTGLLCTEVDPVLRKLCARDLIVLDPIGHLVGTYPFTERPTEHRVRVGKGTVSAMCA